MDTNKTKQKHITDIENVIDSILELEKYYHQMPNDLSKAVDKLNSLRSLAEEDFEVGDEVYNTIEGNIDIIDKVLSKNLYLKNRKDLIGSKFCFKTHY